MLELEAESIQCVITSPPYWGLRKYSGNQDLIWGDNHCEHRWGQELLVDKQGNWDTWKANDGKAEDRFTRKRAEGGSSQGSFCSLCGAWKGAFGLEPTPEMYVQHTIEILREIKRVLRKDGVVFWNIGDSYATSHAEVGTIDRETGWTSTTAKIDMKDRGRTSTKGHPILKPKDLCLIPFRIAIAAQEDGWWVRSVIIWSKPNPMPESVTDRPTESHEYLLMLTKSGTTQFWAHRDGNREAPNPDYRWVNNETHEETDIMPEGWTPKNKMGWSRINLWRGHDYYWDADAVREEYTEPLDRWGGSYLRQVSFTKDLQGKATSLNRERDMRPNESGRNLRSVWEFPTQPYPEAHFAVFPEKLPELCIKAATPEVGCCSKCGKPWVRIVEKKRAEPQRQNWRFQKDTEGRSDYSEAGGWYDAQNITLGWQPTCNCKDATKTPPIPAKTPSVVLDPFMGTGTTLWVAKKLSRKAVGYDTSEEYCRLALERNRQYAMEFSQ